MDNNLTEKEIDELVIAEASGDEGWEMPIRVDRMKPVYAQLSDPPKGNSDKELTKNGK